MSEIPKHAPSVGPSEGKVSGQISGTESWKGHVVQAGEAPRAAAKEAQSVESPWFAFFESMAKGFVGLFTRFVDWVSAAGIEEKPALNNTGTLLLGFVDLLRDGDKIDLDNLTIDDLRRMQSDIVRLKDMGGIEALEGAKSYYGLMAGDKNLNEEGKTLYREISDIYTRVLDSLSEVQKTAEAKLKEGGYSFETEKSISEKDINPQLVEDLKSGLISKMNGSFTVIKGAFSAAFSRVMFEDLKNSKEKGVSSKPVDRLAKELGVPLTKQAWDDIDRMAKHCILKDDNGNEVALYDLARVGKEDDYKPTKKDLLNALRGFCGYNFTEKKDSQHNIGVDEKLFKISRYLCQNLGNTYLAMAGQDGASPQRLADGTLYQVTANGVEDFILIKHKNGFTVESTGVCNSFSSITTVDFEKGGQRLKVDPFVSNFKYRVGMELVEGKDGRLVEQEYKKGFLDCTVKLLPSSMSAAKTEFSSKFRKEFFDYFVESSVIPSEALLIDDGQRLHFLSDAAKEIERQLDKAISPNSEKFLDSDRHEFLLNDRPPYPKGDSVAKKQWIMNFIKYVKGIYDKTEGITPGEADKKLLRFSEQLIDLEHFNIDGEDVVFSKQAVRDLIGTPIFIMNEKKERVMLVDRNKTPYPSTNVEQKEWMNARIKSLMEYCGYEKGGDLKANEIALRNLKVLSSVANQRLRLGYNDVARDSKNSDQRLNDDRVFSIPGNVPFEITISKEEGGGFLVVNNSLTKEGSIDKVIIGDGMDFVAVDKNNSFWRATNGIRLVPSPSGELVPKEYEGGSVEYKIVEQKQA